MSGGKKNRVKEKLQSEETISLRSFTGDENGGNVHSLTHLSLKKLALMSE